MSRIFARNISLLRREKQISQKAAANDLGISQAQLSHYENGIRECSLDFVVKLADYYQVSADYLLGRSTLRNPEDAAHTGEPPAVFSGEQARVQDTLTVIFSVLRRIRSPQLVSLVTSAVEVFLYRLVRTLCTLSGHRPGRTFRLPDMQYDSTASAAETLYLQRVRHLASQAAVRGEPLFEDSSRELTPESLQEDFPQQAETVFDLTESAENELNVWLHMG